MASPSNVANGGGNNNQASGSGSGNLGGGGGGGTISSLHAQAAQVKEIEQLESQGLLREIGHLAVWSLSSCKPGFGVDQLRDGLVSTFWQSDGPQPHVINIQFQRKTHLSWLMLYADYKQDESYTPKDVTIKVGNDLHDLQTVEKLSLEDPVGWIPGKLRDKQNRPVKTFLLQISIEGNHQNGRDTHVRQIKIFSPAESRDQNLENRWFTGGPGAAFTSTEFSMLATCR